MITRIKKKIFSFLLQPLEAKDVVNAVIYVLGAPPHVLVCDLLLFSFSFNCDLFNFFVFLYYVAL